MIYFLLSKNKEINYHLINIDELLIPKSITAISKSRFRKSYFLFYFESPISISVFDDCIFECSKLTSITIPSSLKFINDFAFGGCESLTNVTFESPSSLTSIGNSSFKFCISLTTIMIPSSVKSIGDFAFEFCIKLSKVFFEDFTSLKSVGKNAFFGCPQDTMLAIPSFDISKDYFILERNDKMEIKVPLIPDQTISELGESIKYFVENPILIIYNRSRVNILDPTKTVSECGIKKMSKVLVFNKFY